MTANVWNPGSGSSFVDAESSNLSQLFTTTLAQTVLTLTVFSYVPGSGSVAVFRNGQKLTAPQFTETSSTVVTLDSSLGIVAGEIIEVVAVIGATGANVVAAATSASAAAASAISAAASAASISIPGGDSVVSKTATTGSARMPAGTTAQRDASPSIGFSRWNTTLGKNETWNGTAWVSSGGATGGGSDDCFYENSQTVNSNYTITTNKNAMTAGPITVADGVTVTVPTGSTWSIV